MQCIAFNRVPDEGRKYRSLFVKATDARDYVISLSMGQGGLFSTPHDADKINPATKQRETGTTEKLLTTIKLNEWHTVVLEIRGYEVVGTLSNKLISTHKHSIMLGAGMEASFRRLRVWEPLPNTDWAANKSKLSSTAKP